MAASCPLTCPECGAEFGLTQAMQDRDGRMWVNLIKDLPPVTIKPLIHYLYLFKPVKRGLTWKRKLKLTKELAPMLKAAQVERNGLTYAVPPSQWAEAMTTLVDTPPATLKLPLKGHGYLLSILAGNAEKAAAANEREAEDRKRHRQQEGVQAGAQSVAEIMKKTQREPKPAGWAKNRILGKTGADTNA